MRSRRRSREYALQLLYQWDLRQCPVREVLETFWLELTPDPEVRAYAEHLVQGVVKERRHIDALIEEHSHRWKLERMSLVDRNILRMGSYELLHEPEVPLNVVLNEAIELGKHYSSLESGAFINGILDKIARLAPEPGGEAAPEPRPPSPPGEETGDDDFLFDDE